MCSAVYLIVITKIKCDMSHTSRFITLQMQIDSSNYIVVIFTQCEDLFHFHQSQQFFRSTLYSVHQLPCYSLRRVRLTLLKTGKFADHVVFMDRVSPNIFPIHWCLKIHVDSLILICANIECVL